MSGEGRRWEDARLVEADAVLQRAEPCVVRLVDVLRRRERRGGERGGETQSAR